jgi:hypothetical protein
VTTQETPGETHGKISSECRPPLARPIETTMGTIMGRRDNVEEIRGTHMGRGSQDGNSVPGSDENTSPTHSTDGRRRFPNAPCPRAESEEGVSICEEYHTRLPEHGGLETYSDRGSSGSHQGLVYFPKLHPMTGATDDQRHTVTGSGGVGIKPHI